MESQFVDFTKLRTRRFNKSSSACQFNRLVMVKPENGKPYQKMTCIHPKNTDGKCIIKFCPLKSD